ncbi:mediator of RNA polymerase II transcription subunit 12-like isoform X2 [Brienomyrus brachyistius]|uniref:mediator of RNA polymerase II transcription subunit 12-like isoform X2 n=1 Tax=Brienomyrus brachyistius TaxID=42636 RepID=UPI0020B35CD6|nr:mediator of RNA polymerase II transcription subunit 12-like isoform X2 [Brienomyrus brachyistius]
MEANAEAVKPYLWSPLETKVLVSIWTSTEFQTKFENSTRKSKLYAELAEKLAKAGYVRTPEQIINKIKKMKKEYRDGKTKLGKRSNLAKCFDLLDGVLGCRPADLQSGALNSAIEYLEERASGSSTPLASDAQDSSGVFEDPESFASISTEVAPPQEQPRPRRRKRKAQDTPDLLAHMKRADEKAEEREKRMLQHMEETTNALLNLVGRMVTAIESSDSAVGGGITVQRILKKEEFNDTAGGIGDEAPSPSSVSQHPREYSDVESRATGQSPEQRVAGPTMHCALGRPSLQEEASRSTGGNADILNVIMVGQSEQEQIRRALEQEAQALQRERELTEQLRRAQQQEARALEQQRELTEQLRRAQEQEMKRARDQEAQVLQREKELMEQLRRIQEQESQALESERQAIEQLRRAQEQEGRAIEREREALEQLRRELDERDPQRQEEPGVCSSDGKTKDERTRSSRSKTGDKGSL